MLVGPLAEMADPSAERARLQKESEDAAAQITRVEALLASDFGARAPVPRNEPRGEDFPAHAHRFHQMFSKIAKRDKLPRIQIAARKVKNKVF